MKQRGEYHGYITADITIVAKSKNIPERAGKISLDFKVEVPASLINNKWQVRLTPMQTRMGV